jgi:DNA-binding GntR family transcriptional regulator
MQELSPLERPTSLTDAVVQYVRDAVIAGRLAPGQQLSEAGLAQALGTSRGTVREAMRVLGNMGLVTRVAHRGPVVTVLTEARAREIYTMRDLLETFAARRAAEEGRFGEEAVATLEDRLRALADACRAGDVNAMVEADIQFHASLSALSGHELLMEHLAMIHTHARRMLYFSDLYGPDYGPDFNAVVKRHARLLDIVRSGNPDDIARAVSDHIIEGGHKRVARIAAADVARR